MVFKQLMGAFGVGGPSVETVLAAPHGRPGEQVAGQVHIRGGDQPVDIHQVLVSLVTRVETEYDDHEGQSTREFHRGAITGAFHLAPGQPYSIPFQMPVPWETPITVVHGQHLHGMNMGVRTELEVARAIDKTDLDPIAIHPLPSQQRVLDAFGQLGFRFKGADVEQGHISGVHQQLPFYQEIEFYASHEYSGRINEVELTFVADPHGLVVILEADKRGGLFHEGSDAFGRFHVSHDQALSMPWEQELSGWLQAIIGRRHGGGHGYPPQPGYGYAPGHHDPYAQGGHGHPGYHGGHHGGHRSGPGWGGVAAAGAAGLVGGALIGGGAGAIGDGVEAVGDFAGDAFGAAGDVAGAGFDVAGDVAGAGFDVAGDVFDAAGDGFGDIGDAIGGLFD
ncbi:sporulation protein [Actinomadura scrupuli]|uniref:sporulation protein n=1 Tax=Actinomadura scrupuli TaxID=559629 RepID=UPI003D984D7A